MTRNDLEGLSAWFAAYCREFYTGDPSYDRNIALKEEHTARVRENMLRIGATAGLDGNGLLLAETIALFHDVGRFPQYRRHRTFLDSASVNHALLGGIVLRDTGALDKLDRREQLLVMQGVCLHNRFRLPAGLVEENTRFVKLIRDADKLDIWRVFIDFYTLPEEERASAVGLGFPDVPECSAEVIASLVRGEMVDLATVCSLNDFKLLQLSWVFDLNFAESFRIVRERGLVDGIASTLPRHRDIDSGLEAVRARVMAGAADGGS